MFKVLGAAVAASFLFAAPVSAATHIIDFEGYNVGDVITGYVTGTPYNVLSVRGEIVAGPTGNALKLWPLLGYETVGFRLRDAFTGNYVEPHAGRIVYQPILTGLDYYTPNDATLKILRIGASPIHTLDGGAWSRLNSSEVVDATTYRARTTATYLLLDNIAFEERYGVVPEPATWGLLITGFGLAGSALRRRRAAYV